ncbi:hypothetical protein OPV22_016549 [Ensete ventricosum]|uniref:Uncharacterized protein n=1 Tax=Ensete ventricosum TaxID=4639 RepID=A0AAV8R013_ENSVE|nr:hypothetical protein OPV22_016549 [Ensete ventricosum]
MRTTVSLHEALDDPKQEAARIIIDGKKHHVVLDQQLKDALELGRQLEDQLLMTSGELAVSRLKAQEANKALEEEQQRALALEKGVIATYKESKEFRCGLVWSRQTSYQYGYLVALEHFKAKYLGMSIKEDPFTHPT